MVFECVLEWNQFLNRMPFWLIPKNQMFEWWKQQDGYGPCELHYTKFIRMLGQAHMPVEARALFVEMCGLGLRPSVVTYTCLLQSYAERGQFEEAELLLKDMILSGDAKPNAVTYTGRSQACTVTSM
jgi:pentatricopeptide repeat protein